MSDPRNPFDRVIQARSDLLQRMLNLFRAAPLKKTRPRILIITRNFPPLVGGMERLIFHSYLELLKEFHVALVGPIGCESYVHDETPVSTCSSLPPAKFLIHCQYEALRMANKFKPDLIISGSGFTAPAAYLAAHFCRRPFICFLHGLDIVTKDPIYRQVFLPGIRRADATLVNSRNTAQLAASTGVGKAQIRIINPGVAIPDQCDQESARDFRALLGISSRPVLLSVGRLTRRKGIVELITHALPLVIRECPKVLLLIVGSEAKEAIHGDTGVVDKILETIKRKGIESNVMLLGSIDDEALSKAYRASQLFVFPVIHSPNDVEGFGMVALEAAAHGIPTVAFSTGGVVDAVGDGLSGYLVKPGDYERFARVIVDHLAGAKQDITHSSCKDFASRFSWDIFGKKLRLICREAIQPHPLSLER